MGKTKQNGMLHRLRRGIMCGALSCALALGMMLIMPGMEMMAKAADGIGYVDGIKYYFQEDKKTAEVIGYDSSIARSEIYIPAKIIRNEDNQEYEVVNIKNDGLSFALAIKITLEEGIKQIASGAFYYNYITEIEIPASVYWIESNVFGYCRNLTRVRFKGTTPPSVMFDKNWLGDAAYNIITIELPENADMVAWNQALSDLIKNNKIKMITNEILAF